MGSNIKNESYLNKKTIKSYWQEIKKYKKSFLLMVFFIPTASVILDTIVPYFLSLAIGLLGSGDYDQFYNRLFLVGVIAAIGVIVNLIGYQSAIIHESRVRSGLAHSALANLLEKDQGFFANQRIGALTGKFIDFVNGHVALQDLFVAGIIGFVINMGLGVFLIWQQAPILALVVGILVIALIIQVRISRILRNSLRKQRKALVAESNGLAADVITNNVTVKTFASEDSELSALDCVNLRYRQSYVKDLRLQSFEGSTRILVLQVAQIIAISITGGLLVNSQISLSIAIFVIIYLQRLSSQLFKLGEILFGYDKIMLSATPMTEILIDPPKITDKSSKSLIVKKGDIKFDDLTYSYHDSKLDLVLKDFYLEIPAGQKVGIVGKSGAGKTTLTKLLLRFDDLNSGKILIDNQDIANITQKSLRRSIAYVPQEPLLFHRSLRENIAYAMPNATDAMIIEAAKSANAYEFIQKLPDGLDTVVGERGIKLSGGQRQRVIIARAILKDAPILILDEATSALDSESESLIQDSFKKLMKGRTSLVVAHRLSTISKLDRIIVIDGGKVVEDGSHDELLLKKGHYSKLWNHQSGGFIK